MKIHTPFHRHRLKGRYRACLFALLLSVLTGCSTRNKPDNAARAEPRHVNVVLITLDTTRADHLNCYAGDAASVSKRHARTPNFDVLARQGARFVHATAQVPLTLPSHACIFTGVYPALHGLRDMGGFVLGDRQTLAEVAHHAGLLTAAFVGSKAVARHFGLARGFDLYDDRITPQGGRGLPGMYPRRRAADTTDAALGWLRLHTAGRFLLWVHYYDPHEPYDPPEPYRSQYAGDPYSGAIAYTDAQVGRLLEYLDREKLRDRTLVILIGDHGEGLYDHGEGTHGIFLYEDTLRIPLMIAGPGIAAGETIQPQVRTIDVLPTVAEFLGQPLPAGIQGVSLWPLLRQGRPEAGKGSNYAYLETLYPKTYMGWSELRGIRTDQWKFILAPHPELYDLERDAAEKHNVITQHPAEADQLQKKIWEIIGPPAENQKLAYQALSPEKRQELASLGYTNPGTPREIILNGSGPDPKDRVASLLAMRDYNLLAESGEYAQAAQVMERALRTDPTNPLLSVYRARAYEILHDWRRAILAYRGAAEAGHRTDMILARLGEAYLQINDLDHAIPVLEEATRADPTDLDNLFNLANAYLLKERFADTARTAEAIMALDDHNGSAYNVLGLVRVQQGNIEGARQTFEHALEINPDDPEPMFNLGVLYQKTGQNARALRYFTMFLGKAPRDQYRDTLPLVREAVQKLRGAT